MIRHQRAAMLAVFRLDYVSAARARGLTERRVLWRHAWRNTLAPMITLLGLWLPILVSGADLRRERSSTGPGSAARWPMTPSRRATIPVLLGTAMLVIRRGGAGRVVGRHRVHPGRPPGAPRMIGSLADLLRRALSPPAGALAPGILLAPRPGGDRGPRCLADPRGDAGRGGRRHSAVGRPSARHRPAQSRRAGAPRGQRGAGLAHRGRAGGCSWP